jgi:hypothetical protein
VAVEDEKKECIQMTHHLTENDPTITPSRKNGRVSKHPTTISRRKSPRASLGSGYGYGYGRLCAVHVRQRSTGPAEPLRRRRPRQMSLRSLEGDWGCTHNLKLVALNRGDNLTREQQRHHAEPYRGLEPRPIPVCEWIAATLSPNGGVLRRRHSSYCTHPSM